MLSKPATLGIDEDVESKYPKEQRKRAKYTPHDEQYKTTAQSNQYFTLYAHRLDAMRSILQERCARKYPGKTMTRAPLTSLELEVKANVLTMEEKECILIGALYKSMPLKPNVLKEYTEEVQLLCTSHLFLESHFTRTSKGQFC